MPIKDENKRKEAQKRADAKRAGKRARAWTAMIYQESAPPGWMDRLSELLIEALVSPLHDKDKWTKEDEAANPDHKEGELKKAHWHVVISFKNPATYAKAREAFEAIGAVVPPEPQCKVKDFKQMARYLCHLDQPHKHRYDKADVKSFGAVDYTALVMSGADEDEILDEIFGFISANHVLSFREFVDYVRMARPEWRVLVYHQYAALITRYIKAMAWELEKGYEPSLKLNVNEDGEILGYAVDQKQG